MTDKTKITIEVRDLVTIALVIATEPAIAEIRQQLAWLAAALRPSPSNHMMAYSTPSVTLSTGNTPTDKAALALPLPHRSREIRAIHRRRCRGVHHRLEVGLDWTDAHRLGLVGSVPPRAGNCHHGLAFGEGGPACKCLHPMAFCARFCQ